jgi:hypothetical protein
VQRITGGILMATSRQVSDDVTLGAMAAENGVVSGRMDTQSRAMQFVNSTGWSHGHTYAHKHTHTHTHTHTHQNTQMHARNHTRNTHCFYLTALSVTWSVDLFDSDSFTLAGLDLNALLAASNSNETTFLQGKRQFCLVYSM